MRRLLVVRKRRINWALKAVLPIAAVLLNGLLLFLLVSSSLAPGPRNDVIAVAAGGAFVICVAVIMVLAVQVRRPMMELQEKFARVQLGDMDVAVSFADRNDEIGDLGRDFNDMVAQLKASREEIQRLAPDADVARRTLRNAWESLPAGWRTRSAIRWRALPACSTS